MEMDEKLWARTAVVMLCVSNGAVFSFAWYLYGYQHHSTGKYAPSAHGGVYSPTERHCV